jgi:hypothetical protein
MLNKLVRGEKGQALLIVLLMMLFGSLIIPPLLSHISTGLWTGKVVYEGEMKLLYAADAGVENALWQIKNGRLPTLLHDYDPYKYDYPYRYPDYPNSLVVDDRNVGITIGNVWIPKDINKPSSSKAENIVKHGKLIITGGISQISATQYQIGIIYYYGSEGTDALRVEEIGIWLPPGFQYVEDSCSLANDPDTQSWATPEVSDYRSGKAVVWTFGSPMFKVFPGIPTTPPIPNPMISTITFAFTGPAGQNPQAAISWIDTSGVNNLVPGFSGITYTWDADKKVYEINSMATYAGKQTEVDAYTAKIEPRQIGAAVSGDYVAIGNTLMTPTAAPSCRDRLYKESSASITTGSGYGHIPAGATVEAVYLYWSGWIDHFYWYYKTTDSKWNFGELAELNRLNYETDLTTLVETNAKVNTVNFNGENITTHLWQVCPKDNDTPGTWYYTCLYDVTDMVKQPIENAIKPGGSGTYNFTLGHASTVVNQLRPSCPGQRGDTSGVSIYNFLLYNTTDYTGYPLATPAHTASGGTASSYETRYNAAYAGWSLVIIYSSPDTNGHQLYLYDIKNPNFRFTEGFGSHTDPDFDGDGNPGGRISGFLVPAQISGEVNAAKLTCFVGEGDVLNTGDYIKITGPRGGTGTKLWDGITITGSNTKTSPNNIWNSQSLVLGTVSGVDIDTPGIDPTANPAQYITWSSNVLRQGDTYATINLPSPGDGFTLIYIILSFRSEITTGGTMSYLVR